MSAWAKRIWAMRFWEVRIFWRITKNFAVWIYSIKSSRQCGRNEIFLREDLFNKIFWNYKFSVQSDVVNERISDYSTIRTESDYFKGFWVQLFGIKYYRTISLSDFFWIYGKIWEKGGDIWWNIWLFGHPNPTIWNFKLSEPIRVRLFDIRRYLYPTFWYPLIYYHQQVFNIH